MPSLDDHIPATDAPVDDQPQGLRAIAPIMRARGRRPALYLVAAIVIGVGIHFLYPAVAGLGRSIDVVKEANPWWIAAAVVFSAASLGCYVAIFRFVVGEGDDESSVKLGWRASYQTVMASQAASTLITAAGAGGVALMLWVLARAGLGRREAVTRLVAFLVFHYVIYLAAIVFFGFGLWFGIFPGPSPAALTLVPAIVAAAALVLVAIAASRPGGFEQRFTVLSGRTSRAAGIARRLVSVPSMLADGVRYTGLLLRSTERGTQIITASFAYWVTNIAILWACFEAFGAHPDVAGLVQAFFIGMTANLLPLLPGGVGSVEAGLIGALLAFGEPGAQVVVSVLAYRLISYWIPTIPEAVAYFQLRRTIDNWDDEGPGAPEAPPAPAPAA